MLRMELTCIFVLLFLAIMYFSVKRQRTALHKTFAAILIVLTIHLFFDGATVYTVNQLDNVPRWLNDVLHKIYTGTMLLTLFLFERYVSKLLEEEVEGLCQDRAHRIAEKLAYFYMLVGEFLMLVLPVEYTITADGNYESGPSAWVLYVSAPLYMLQIAFLLVRNWKHTHIKKKLAVTVSLVTEGIVLIAIELVPTLLLSGMGLTLMTLAFYLGLENPDLVLLEQARAEKRRAEEANASKSRFISVVSHEIRTPMNVIVGMTDLLLKDDLSEKQRLYLQNIKNSGSSLVMIVNDILDQSKIEAGKMEIVEAVYELKPLVEDVRLIIENRVGKKPIEVMVSIDEKIPERLIGDSLRIRQVLINLMNNAVKYTEAGFVKLLIESKAKTEEKEEIRFSVMDSGQGIRKEELGKLGEAFSQIDIEKNYGKEGTGLGLSISRDFIALMGGQLTVQSEYGKGSEFSFVIEQKIADSSKEIASVKSLQRIDRMKVTAPKARILVVDDTEVNLLIAESVLEMFAVRHDAASSGEKALRMIRENPYDLILMDYRMPYMDGAETTRKLREIGHSFRKAGEAERADYYEKLPVIALTAEVNADIREELLAAGMNDVTEKPIEVKQIKRLLAKWIPDQLVMKEL